MTRKNFMFIGLAPFIPALWKKLRPLKKSPVLLDTNPKGKLTFLARMGRESLVSDNVKPYFEDGHFAVWGTGLAIGTKIGGCIVTDNFAHRDYIIIGGWLNNKPYHYTILKSDERFNQNS